MLEPARSVARKVSNMIAKHRVARSSALEVAASARVNYRRIRIAPATIIISENSIVDSDIYSYRPNSILSVGARSFLGGAEIHCAGRIIVDDDVLVAWGCMIMDHNAHSISRVERRNDVVDVLAGREKDWSVVRVGTVHICSGAWICARSIILRDVTVGEGAIVGAGSVVTRDVAPYTLVAGSPAQVVRSLSRE